MRIAVLGIGIDAMTMGEAVALLEEHIKAGTPELVVTANAEMVMAAQSDRHLAEVLDKAGLVIPDGAGVVWASRKLGCPVPERVAGFDLAQELLKKAADKNYGVYFFGSAPGIAAKAAEVAGNKYPGLRVVGIRNGYFSAADEPEIIREIKTAKPDILLIALGVPKQEKWLDAHFEQLQIPVAMGVGGTFDVMAGVARRAPLWMQHYGLEWLFRLACQPQRMRRMLVLPHFVLKVVAAKKH